jgi:hypothetical protein
VGSSVAATCSGQAPAKIPACGQREISVEGVSYRTHKCARARARARMCVWGCRLGATTERRGDFHGANGGSSRGECVSTVNRHSTGAPPSLGGAQSESCAPRTDSGATAEPAAHRSCSVWNEAPSYGGPRARWVGAAGSCIAFRSGGGVEFPRHHCSMPRQTGGAPPPLPARPVSIHLFGTGKADSGGPSMGDRPSGRHCGSVRNPASQSVSQSVSQSS